MTASLAIPSSETKKKKQEAKLLEAVAATFV